MPSPAEPIAIAGAGRVAQALGRLLRESGWPVVAVASRHRDRAERAAAFIGGDAAPAEIRELPGLASHLIVAVSDGAIASVAQELAEGSAGGGVALHTCGSLGPEALAPLRERGYHCGVLHPLQSVPSPDQGVSSLPGSTFALGGEPAAVRWGEEIISALGARALRIRDDAFPLYHAGAVVAGNGMFGLVETAIALFARAGVDRPRAIEALGPLCRRSLENALTIGPAALTGPVARGDIETLRRHRAALSATDPIIAEAYESMTRVLLEVTRR